MIAGSTIKPISKPTTKAKSGTGVIIPAVAGVGVAGATAGGLAYLAKQKKDSEDGELTYKDDEELAEQSKEGEEVEEEPIDALDDRYEEEGKEWLYDLGLGKSTIQLED